MKPDPTEEGVTLVSDRLVESNKRWDALMEKAGAEIAAMKAVNERTERKLEELRHG